MKRVSLSVVMIVAMLSVAVATVHAQQPAQQPRSGSQEVVAAAFSAEVSGVVKSVNEKSGKMVLDTAEGPVSIKFPAEAVRGLKKGDPVTVSIGLVKPAPSASPQTSPGTK